MLTTMLTVNDIAHPLDVTNDVDNMIKGDNKGTNETADTIHISFTHMRNIIQIQFQNCYVSSQIHLPQSYRNGFLCNKILT